VIPIPASRLAPPRGPRSSLRHASHPLATVSTPLVVVSNRLPYDIGRPDATGRRNVGGLVNALEPVFHRAGGVWIGWDGITLPTTRGVTEGLVRPRRLRSPGGGEYVGVPLSERELSRYYHGLCNRALWPLLHDFPDKGSFLADDWAAYVEVNRRFAAVAAAHAPRDGRIWVHDYQLMLVPRFLRESGFDGRVDFFLHTPFPPAEIFRALPWRAELLDGLLAADAVVFHTARYRDNFIDLVRSVGEAVVSAGPGGTSTTITARSRSTVVASEAIGIDVEGFTTLAAAANTTHRARRIRSAYGDRPIVFGAERLDYTKGVLERLWAIERLLRLHPDLEGSFAFVQVVVPSRHVVEEYRRMKRDIDREVGRINGEFGADGWQPVHYRYRALDRAELVAHYRAASVALVTPLRDGMNLVAAEFAASRVDGDGVLVLSEFAGIADTIDGAILVNPNDIDGLAEAIDRALRMPLEERRERMGRMRPSVLANPAAAWAERCLAVGTPQRSISWNAT
jgi:trehalose 6-phosphate synthase/phosphatase